MKNCLRVRRKFISMNRVIVDIQAQDYDQAVHGYRIFTAATRGRMVPARSRQFLRELNEAV